MNDPDELALVIRALTCGVTGCVEWEPKQAERLRSDPYLQGLTPEGIQSDVIQYVQNHPGSVRQVRERRREYSYRRYYYKVTLPYPDLFRNGLFVEMELFDPVDPDLPVVTLLNAHE